MPPLPPIANVVRVACTGIYGDTNWANIFYIQYTGTPPTNATLNTLAADIASDYQTNMMTGLVSLNKLLTVVTLTDLSSSTGATGTWAGSLAGNGANPSLPAQVCIGLRWVQQLRYRGGHPRTYINGIPGSHQQTQKLITAAAQTAWVAGGGAFRTAINANTGTMSPMTLGTVSYWQNNARRVAPLFLPYTGVTVDLRLDTQRRRLGRDVA